MSKSKVQQALFAALPSQPFKIEADDKQIKVTWIDGPAVSVVETALSAVELGDYTVGIGRGYSVSVITPVLRDVCKRFGVENIPPVKQSSNGLGFFVSDKETKVGDDGVLLRDVVRAELNEKDFYVAPDKRITVAEVGDYKGFPTFAILDEDGERVISFGLKKAQAILAHLTELQKFVSDNQKGK